MINDTNDIKVSVCVVTYNQEKYIAECLDSLVSQETDFKFEIIVGEDCSTDGTRAIVQQYVDKYPDIVKPIFHKNNVGAVENVKQVYIAAKGKYIAHMDGDDMALPTKLQKQFDIMEKNPQAMICSHNVSGILTNNLVKKHYIYCSEGEYTFIDLVKRLPFFAHSSKLFRVTNDIDLYNILSRENILDIELHLYHASKGTIIHLEEDLGIYRTDVGVSAIKNNKLNYKMIESVVDVYEELKVSNPEIISEIKKAYASYLLGAASNFAIIESDAGKMRKYTIKSFEQKSFSMKQVVMIIFAFFPKIGIRILRTRYNLRTLINNKGDKYLAKISDK